MAEDAIQGHRLQSLLGFQEHYVATTVAAQVIGGSGSDASRVLYIDKGSNDGLRPDQAVITPDGIVGKLRDVFPRTSQVQLINDPTSGAGVLLETTRIRGILRGSLTGQIQINNLTPDSRIKPGEVVLSLFSSQASYGRGQLPVFDVDVVSTSAQACAFNVGPRFLTLVITAGGKRIWSSADCVAGPGSLLTNLARGVPTVVPLSWDRETSAPGCRVTSRQVTTGSFAAAASDAGLASNPLTFTLS